AAAGRHRNLLRYSFVISLDLLLLIFAGIFGAVLGSFLNALTFRYNTGAPWWRAMGGRSRCMRCGHELSVLDLVPIFSWIFLRGRCRYCGAPISVQYPLVELAAALLAIGVYWQVSQVSLIGILDLASGAWVVCAFWLLVWMTILFLVVYDWRHLILPMGALVLLGILGAVSLFFACSSTCHLVLPMLWPLLGGPIIALPLFLLWLVSRGRWMGLGDSLFALPMGWMLGLAGGFSALALAFWSGAIIGLALLGASWVISRRPSFRKVSKDCPRKNRSRFSMKTEIPFGPFLALGAALVFFFHLNVLALFML
ncbi:MAG: prepilin peptidase, partial [Minisyncoccia bacterium]